MKAVIFNIQRFSIHDGDGIRTTVFFKGCPLRCPWCHNPESQKSEPQLMFYKSKCIGCRKCFSVCDARNEDGFDREKCLLCGKCIGVCNTGANEIVGREMTVDEIISVVKKDKIFYKDNGGMTLSGGEPSMQSKFALELIKKAADEDIRTVIETCGFGNPEFFRIATELNVSFYFDIKAIDREKHKKLTGQYNDIIFENLRLLFSLGAKVVLRLPMIPGINDTENDLMLLREFLSNNRENYSYAEIMKYHNLGISKADALGVKYTMSNKNATDGQVEYWLQALNFRKNKIIYN